MSKEKYIKTNAMRILDKNKLKYKITYYECDDFIDGITIARKLSLPFEKTFKTLVSVGKSGNYFVFVIPVDSELDMKKAAKSVDEKSVQLIHVKDITEITGYIRGGCTPIGMKKQFPVVLNDSAKKFDIIYISGGKRGIQMEIAPDDLIKVTKGKYCDIIY